MAPVHLVVPAADLQKTMFIAFWQRGLPKGFGRAPERFPKGFRKVSERFPKGSRKVPEMFPKGPRTIPERFSNVSGPPEAFRVRNKCYKYEVFNIAPFPERFRGSETVREPFGNLSGTFREPFGKLLETFREPFGTPLNLSGALPKPFGNLLGTFRNLSGHPKTFGTHPKPFGNPPETSRGGSKTFRQTFRRILANLSGTPF